MTHKLSLIISILLMLGCGGSEGDKTEITFWVMPNSLEPQRDLERLIADFEVSHPELDVVIVVLDWGAAWTKITTAAISGVAPDLCQIGTTWVGTISSMDALLNLNDRIAEIDSGRGFVPASWATRGIAGSGQTTTIPWFVDVRALYYRTDVFRKLGLTEKDLETWESFKRALVKIKQANLTIDGIKVEPLGYPGKNDWNVIHNLAPWIWGAGGAFLSPDHSHCWLNAPESLRGLRFYMDLALEGLVPIDCLELNSQQVEANFNNGKYAICFSPAHLVRILSLPPEQGGASNSIAARNYATALFPKGPRGRFQFLGGSNLGIFKSSKHHDQAWELIKFLVSPQKQIEYCKITGFMPALKAAYDDPYIAQDPRRAVFKEAIAYGRSYPCIPGWGPMEPILMRRLGNLYDLVAGVYGKFNEEKFRQELDALVREIDTILEESR